VSLYKYFTPLRCDPRRAAGILLEISITTEVALFGGGVAQVCADT